MVDRAKFKLEFFPGGRTGNCNGDQFSFAGEAMKLSRFGIARNEINSRWGLGFTRPALGG